MLGIKIKIPDLLRVCSSIYVLMVRNTNFFKTHVLQSPWLLAQGEKMGGIRKKMPEV